ncbi:MAG: type II toxin-antitoxin system RelE/ParE family toxin [Nitrosomonas sp.]|nr:type II toxin-antitoxin system RelE/ParE family toxin [Nitrosomonas sp.]
MIATVKITPRALEDLKKIGRYTLQKWGKNKRDSYLRDLDNRFGWLAENPKIGKHRTDIEAGYYCYLQGSHLIFYTIGEDCIHIIGIPHKAMDIFNYFDPD